MALIFLLCGCPQAAAIPDIPDSSCPEDFGQVQKVMFQREKSAGVKNVIADPALLASWTPLLTAADGTKVVQSPFLAAPTTEPGAVKEYGGGNETPNGIAIVVGREPTKFTANMLQVNQRAAAAMKQLSCDDLTVYLIDEFGAIICLADDVENPTEYFGIPIKSLFVGDKALGGFDNPDMNGVSWSFLPNWSDNLVRVTPADFDALTDLTV